MTAHYTVLFLLDFSDNQDVFKEVCLFCLLAISLLTRTAKRQLPPPSFLAWVHAIYMALSRTMPPSTATNPVQATGHTSSARHLIPAHVTLGLSWTVLARSSKNLNAYSLESIKFLVITKILEAQCKGPQTTHFKGILWSTTASGMIFGLWSKRVDLRL